MNNSGSQVDMIKKVHHTVQNMIAEARHIIKPLSGHYSPCRDKATDKLIGLPPVKVSSFLRNNVDAMKDNWKQASSINNSYKKKIQGNRGEYCLFPMKKKQRANKNQQISFNNVKIKCYNDSLSVVENELLNIKNFRRCSKRYSLVRAQIKKKQLIKSSSSHYEPGNQPKYIVTISNQGLLNDINYSQKNFNALDSKDEKEDSVDQTERRRKRRVRISTLQMERGKSMCRKSTQDKYSPWQTGAEDPNQQYFL